MEYPMRTQQPQQQNGSATGHEVGGVTIVRPVEGGCIETEIQEPDDTCRVVRIMFFVLGTAITLPWTLFVVINDYWMCKLQDENANGSGTTADLTKLQAQFTTYLGVASTIPNSLFLILNALYGHKISLRNRMVGSLSTMMLLFLIMMVLVNANTGPGFFLFLVLTTAVIMNIASAVFQGGLLGMVGRFASGHITLVMCGQAIGVVLGGLSLLAYGQQGTSPTNIALTNFTAAVFVLGIAIGAYFVLSKSDFFNFHMVDHINLINSLFDAAAVESSRSPVPRSVLYKNILRKTWVFGYALGITYFISLAMYPAMTKFFSWNKDKDTSEVHYVPAIGLLAFSAADFKGRLTAGRILWPKGAKVIATVATFRVLAAIPVFLIYKPYHVPPIYNSTSGIANMVFILVFALLHGYLTNITFISVSSSVDNNEQESAMSIMAALVGIGQFCGQVIYWLL